MENLIYKKIAAILADSDAIGKDRINNQQGFRFRGIDDVYNSLHPILAKHGVFSTTTVLEDRTEERQSARGGTLIYRILKVQFTFYAEDGSFVQSVVIGEGMDSGDKASNKAMAIAHKYALLQLLAIPTGDAKDPDAESHEVLPKKQSTPQSTPQATPQAEQATTQATVQAAPPNDGLDELALKNKAKELIRQKAIIEVTQKQLWSQSGHDWAKFVDLLEQEPDPIF